MHFQRQDLNGQHYFSTTRHEDLNSGQPSCRSFDRSNGNQVLFLINFYGSLSGCFTLKTGKRMEEKIINDLPPGTKSEITILNWIRDHINA